jgi:hypothetical protein
MQESPDMPEAEASSLAPSAPAEDAWGWYLYGIIPATEQGAWRPGDVVGMGVAPSGEDGEALEAITAGDLVAVVRRVPVAEFAPEALRAHAEDLSWLETMARRHNNVIDAVHRTRTILPAKFGCVYERAEDVRTALAEEHDALRDRLSWIDGCDEWGVRLYGDVATIRQRVDEEQERMRRLRGDAAAASPGRAYLLQHKLAEEQAGALDQVLDDVASQAYTHCARHARAGQISRQLAASRIPPDQPSAELLRAAFLVPHTAADAFIEDVRQFAEGQPGLWCEHSGPWPPYSFAAELEGA